MRREPELAARYVRQQGVRFYAIGVGGTEPVAVTFEGNPILLKKRLIVSGDQLITAEAASPAFEGGACRRASATARPPGCGRAGR